MVETGGISNVLKKFENAKLNLISGGKTSGLEDKLRQRYAEAKRKHLEEIGSGTIEYGVEVFNRNIEKGLADPFEHKQTIKDADGKDCDVVLKFADGYCDVVSDLFPQPFWIIPDDKMEKVEVHKQQDVTIYSVSNFIKIFVILKKFGGTVKF
jgi:hypothetical protein